MCPGQALERGEIGRSPGELKTKRGKIRKILVNFFFLFVKCQKCHLQRDIEKKNRQGSMTTKAITGDLLLTPSRVF